MQSSDLSAVVCLRGRCSNQSTGSYLLSIYHTTPPPPCPESILISEFNAVVESNDFPWYSDQHHTLITQQTRNLITLVAMANTHAINITQDQKTEFYQTHLGSSGCASHKDIGLSIDGNLVAVMSLIDTDDDEFEIVGYVATINNGFNMMLSYFQKRHQWKVIRLIVEPNQCCFQSTYSVNALTESNTITTG